MYSHHVSSAGRPVSGTSSPRVKLFSSTIRTVRHGLVAIIPILLFALILLCCIQGIEPAAEAAADRTASSPLDQPPVTSKGPGRYLHVTGQIRMAPCSGFSELSPTADFSPIEFWFNEHIDFQWCIASPYALAYTYAGESFAFSECPSTGVEVKQIPGLAYCHVPTVGYFLWGRELFPLEYSVARCRRHIVTSSISQNGTGREITTVVILPSNSENCQPIAGLEHHKWFNPAYKKTYVFDTKTHDLIGASISTSVNGKSITLFETSSIVYRSSSAPPSSIATAIETFAVRAAIAAAGKQSDTPR